MILLTKLNQQKVLINLDSVKYIESVPDTLIFFTNGESVMVREDIETVAQSVKEYQAQIFKASQSQGTSESPSF